MFLTAAFLLACLSVPALAPARGAVYPPVGKYDYRTLRRMGWYIDARTGKWVYSPPAAARGQAAAPARSIRYFRGSFTPEIRGNTVRTSIDIEYQF